MKNQLSMPKLHPEMKDGVLCAWLKEPGDSYVEGEAVFEVETEKVVNQVEADRPGIMGRHLVDEGDTVAVGAPVAEVE